MTAIERTAYPRPRQRPDRAELRQHYDLTEAEHRFLSRYARGQAGRLLLAVMLKTRAHLGLFPAPNDVTSVVVVPCSCCATSTLLAFELGQANVPGGPLNDLITVTGDLTLDGLLSVTETAGGSFTAGVYRLIDFGGSLTDNVLLIAGALPNGLGGTIQTAIANQVNLVVTAGGGGTPSVQYWDGSNVVANGTVDGGTGTWNATNTNWTDHVGAFNDVWGGLVAVFAGQTGVVTVEGTQAFTGLQFATDDYRLVTGAAGALDLGTGAFVFVDNALGASIDVAIGGTGRLDKQGDGRLLLTADSSFAGGTTVSAGTLAIGSSGALGTSDVVLGDGVGSGYV